MTASRRRCRLPVVNAHAGLCFRHLSQQAAKGAALHPVSPGGLIPLLDSPDPNADLRVTLAGELKDFKSAAEINDFLSRLLLVLSENRVTPRRAAVLAYVCNLLLRTLPAMDRELHAGSFGDDSVPGIDFGDLAKPSPGSFLDSPPPSDSRALGTV